LLLSCGASLHHLQVAARALGVDAEIAVEVRDDTVALVRLTRGAPATEAEVESAVAILHRHTHRGRFTDEAVSAEDLDRVLLAVESERGLLRVVHQDELVAVEVVVSRAEQSLQSLDGYAGELARWVWHGLPDEERGDGLPQDALDHDPTRAESLEGRQFDGDRLRPLETPVAEHPTVVLLTSAGDTPADWVQSGRALSALLLIATEAGLLAQPIAQVIDVPSARYALAQLLGIVGTPQMLLRLGHGTSVPATPRRPLAEVLSA
ncbi:MAG: nitroreductase, partial [Frankiales bacterium]|nr:nitroreductase [Frankiales bacterium]